MADAKPFDLRQVLSAIISITALVTAGTSLVKAVDKTLEQTSYEALAGKIAEIQKDQTAMRNELAALRWVPVKDGDGIPDLSDPPGPLASASAAATFMVPASPPVVKTEKPHPKHAPSMPMPMPAPVAASPSASAAILAELPAPVAASPSASAAILAELPAPLPPAAREAPPQWEDIRNKARAR